MLQKIENLYLAILRLAVILVAGTLLVGVIVFGVNSFKALQTVPEEKSATPHVSDEALKKQLTTQAQPTAEAVPQTDSKSKDPNDPLYTKAAGIIATFVRNQSQGTEVAEKDNVIQVLKGHAERFRENGHTTVYISNYTESLESLLKDPEIIVIAKKTSPLNLINNHLNSFTTQFNDEIKKVESEYEQRRADNALKQADGRRNLYFAGAAFGTFLMIVFLSIFIRIERNLRHLEKLPTQ